MWSVLCGMLRGVEVTPPPTNPVNSQLPTNVPVLTHSTLESTAMTRRRRICWSKITCTSPSTSHTQPIHHHVSSQRDGLRGWFEPFDWRAFVNFEIHPLFLSHQFVAHQGINSSYPLESWPCRSDEWELVAKSLLTSSFVWQGAFGELFSDLRPNYLLIVYSIMPACSHHRWFIQSWHRRGNYCKFGERAATVS